MKLLYDERFIAVDEYAEIANRKFFIIDCVNHSFGRSTNLRMWILRIRNIAAFT